MRPDLTDITLVVDRSGSMEQVQEDAQVGVNSFIKEQAKEPAKVLLVGGPGGSGDDVMAR